MVRTVNAAEFTAALHLKLSLECRDVMRMQPAVDFVPFFVSLIQHSLPFP